MSISYDILALRSGPWYTCTVMSHDVTFIYKFITMQTLIKDLPSFPGPWPSFVGRRQ